MASDSNKLLDETGWRLLQELQVNARLSYAELGRRVGLSLPAVSERIRKMEEAGIIVGYRAEVDTTKIGYPISAFIRMHTVGEHSLQKMKTILPHMPEVMECHHLAGADYFIIKVATASIEELEALIERLQSYGQTTASIVLSTLVTTRALGKEPASMLEDEEEGKSLPLKARISMFRPPGE